MWQDLAALVVVVAAVAYLAWKYFGARRRPARPKRGPDVPLSRLKRK